jgi:hypothetical protein
MFSDIIPIATNLIYGCQYTFKQQYQEVDQEIDGKMK